MCKVLKAFIAFTALTLNVSYAQKLLIPMDNAQNDHLRAYGLVYWCLEAPRHYKGEWLLNYRGGSFVVDDREDVREKASIMGVSVQPISAEELNAIYQIIEANNMDVITLEKAPKIAIYKPVYSADDESFKLASDLEPWDDAVQLALDYAGIKYDILGDEEILSGKLVEYDWLHCHHEDFTGQFGKFYSAYKDTIWYQRHVSFVQEAAKKAGFRSVQEFRCAQAKSIKDYVLQGGFLFMMCTPDTLDIALAAEGIDIIPPEIDGTPITPNAQSKLDFSKTFAFKDFILETRAEVYEFSNIDNPKVSLNADDGTEDFELFEFAAKYDPVPTMLTQNHVARIKGFLGQTTSFNRSTLKDNVVVLGDIPGSDYVKYIHGNCGKGTFTFLGGHDPEDYRHQVGDPPTNLSLHKNSPGYRLILNNILFPAAKEKKRKT